MFTIKAQCFCILNDQLAEIIEKRPHPNKRSTFQVRWDN